MPHNPSRLEVIHRANAVVVAVHAIAELHRKRLGDVSPGLRNQLVRSVTSISLNLSEACGYHTPTKTAAFLDIAIGSCNEVERVLDLCQQLDLLDASVSQLILDVQRVRKMTYGLRSRVLQGPAAAQQGPSANAPTPTSDQSPVSQVDRSPVSEVDQSPTSDSEGPASDS